MKPSNKKFIEFSLACLVLIAFAGLTIFKYRSYQENRSRQKALIAVAADERLKILANTDNSSRIPDCKVVGLFAASVVEGRMKGEKISTFYRVLSSINGNKNMMAMMREIVNNIYYGDLFSQNVEDAYNTYSDACNFSEGMAKFSTYLISGKNIVFWNLANLLKDKN